MTCSQAGSLSPQRASPTAFLRGDGIAARSLWVLYCLLVSASKLASQSIPVRTLTAPDRVFSRAFTKVSGIRELTGDRVVVLDADVGEVVILDSVGFPKKLGREGQGPGEYARPLRLLELPQGKTGIVDGSNSSILQYGPDGGYEARVAGRWDRACTVARV